MRLKRQDILSTFVTLLAIIGALNWGLVGLFNFDLVSRVFGKAKTVRRAVYDIIGLAGAWSLLGLALPAVGVQPIGRRPSATVLAGERSIVGQKLPALEGSTLTGRKVRLPDDTKGKVALLVMGFAYEARWDVEDWVRNFRKRFADRDDMTFLEMPMIGGLWRLLAPAIETGMRQGTPSDLHNNVVTVYANMGPIHEVLGATEASDTWVYLVGRDGTVLFQVGGGWDPTEFDQLADIAESAAKR